MNAAPRPLAAAGSTSPSDRPAKQSRTILLTQVYREALEQYLRALTFQRRSRLDRRWFRYSVLGGQVGVLAIALLAAIVSVRPWFSTAPAERLAVERWIRERHGEFTIVQWRRTVPDPAQPDAVIVRVAFSYSPKRGKPIETALGFTVQGNRVLRVDSSP